MRNFQGIMFIWIWINGKIFKSALVYFQSVLEKNLNNLLDINLNVLIFDNLDFVLKPL